MNNNQPIPPPPGLGNYKPDYLVAKKSKLGLILGIICTVVALFGVAIAIFFAIVMLKTLSENDYKATADKIEGVTKTYEKVIALDFEIDSMRYKEAPDYSLPEKQEQAIKKLQQEFSELGDMAVIKRNNDLKQDYAKAKTRLDRYIQALTVSIEANGRIAPIVDKLGPVDRLAAMKEKYENLQKITSSLKDENNKLFVSTVIKLTKKQEKIEKERLQAKQEGNFDLVSKKESELQAAFAEEFKVNDSWRQKIEALLKHKESGALFNDLKFGVNMELHRIEQSKRKH